MYSSKMICASSNDSDRPGNLPNIAVLVKYNDTTAMHKGRQDVLMDCSHMVTQESIQTNVLPDPGK